jgi:5-methylcytosine-specific restriction endonuclease McrA
MPHFNDDIINDVWNKAKVQEGNNPAIWRKDFAGAWIRRDQYGKTSMYGWEIDHLKPSSMMGKDDLNNLWPMHWENNRRKGDDYPEFFSSKTSQGTTNIDATESWKATE